MTDTANMVIAGGIATITINRPERRNALDARTSHLISAFIDRAEGDADVGVIILTAMGDLAFCSGMDLKEAAAIGAGQGLVPGKGFAGVTERRFNKPVIAAVNGAAVAGGFEIALGCDIIIAAEQAIFGLPEVKRGMYAFAGGVQRLAQRLPRSLAMSIILTGDPVSAQRLYDIGVISELTPTGAALPRAQELAQVIMANSHAALRGAKQLFDMSIDLPIEQAMRVGNAIGFVALKNDDTREGIGAYVDKRDAGFASNKPA